MNDDNIIDTGLGTIYVQDYKNPYRGTICAFEGCIKSRSFGSCTCSKAHSKALGEWYCPAKTGSHYTLLPKTTRGVCEDCCKVFGWPVKFKKAKTKASEPVIEEPASVVDSVLAAVRHGMKTGLSQDAAISASTKNTLTAFAVRELLRYEALGCCVDF